MPARKFLSGLERQTVLAQAGIEQIFRGISFEQIHVLADRVGADLGGMGRVLQLPGAVDAGQFQHALQVSRALGHESGFFRRRASEIAFAARPSTACAGISFDEGQRPVEDASPVPEIAAPGLPFHDGRWWILRK